MKLNENTGTIKLRPNTSSLLTRLFSTIICLVREIFSLKLPAQHQITLVLSLIEIFRKPYEIEPWCETVAVVYSTNTVTETVKNILNVQARLQKIGLHNFYNRDLSMESQISMSLNWHSPFLTLTLIDKSPNWNIRSVTYPNFSHSQLARDLGNFEAFFQMSSGVFW